MNDLDLREQFEQWAEPLRVTPAPDVEQLRRRARRRSARRFTVAASAVAMAGLACVLFTGFQEANQSTLAPHERSYQPPTPFVHQRYTAPRAAPFELVFGHHEQLVRVVDAASGLTVFASKPLGPDPDADSFFAVAAASSDRLFVLAQQGRQGPTSFDILRVGAGAAGIAPVMPGVSLPPGTHVYHMTVNPQGTRLALNTSGFGGANWRLQVYNLITGALLDNFSESGGALNLQYWPSADQLAFSWLASPGGDGSGLRVLDTAEPVRSNSPGALLADSTLVPAARGFAVGMFTTDGAVAIVVDQSHQPRQVVEYSVATGRVLHSITLGPAWNGNQSEKICGVLWASSDGADLVTQCMGLQQEVVNGKATRVRLAVTVRPNDFWWLPAPTFAW